MEQIRRMQNTPQRDRVDRGISFHKALSRGRGFHSKSAQDRRLVALMEERKTGSCRTLKRRADLIPADAYTDRSVETIPEMIFTITMEKLCPKPRMTRRDKWAKRPCVVKWHDFKDKVAIAYRERRGRMYCVPIAVAFRFTVSNKRRMDLDNLIKGFLDALLGVAFSDDNINIIRRYDYAEVTTVPVGEFESATITIRPLAGRKG